jgi:sporulation protein YlmC with PRC-barrel domain
MRYVLMNSVFALGCGLIMSAGQLLFADDTPSGAPAPEPTSAKVSDLLSLKVYGSADEAVGKVEDLVLDPSSGKIRYAVLSFGGILGIGDKYFAVPWNDLTLFHKGATSAGTQKELYYTIDVSKDTLKNAPGFNKNHWPNFADKTFVRDVEAFYGSNRSAAKIHGETR